MPIRSLSYFPLAGLCAAGALAAQVAATAAAQQQPIAFVPNVGQWQRPTCFEARFGAAEVFLERDGFRLSLAEPRTPRRGVRSGDADRIDRTPRLGVGLHLQFVGAAAATVAAAPGAALAEHHNYFLGDDRSRWRTDVPTTAAVRYAGLYPGVDVRCYMRDGHFEYDVELAPGADLAHVAIEVAGADALRLQADGSLVFDTALGPVRQPAPSTFVRAADGALQPIAAQFRLLSPTRFGFAVPEWRGDQTLVVDPGIVWSTTLAGGFLGDLVVSPTGVLTATGSTNGLGYPATVGAYRTTPSAGGDSFVTRIDPSQPTAQQHRYTTYFGGSGGDVATELVVDAAGRITVLGSTDSTNFPTTPGAFDTTFNGGTLDAFVLQLDPSLTGQQQLRWSTYLGGNGDDLPYDLALGPQGELIAAGFSDSSTFPTSANAYDPTVSSNGGSAVVSWLDPNQTGAAQLIYSTFLGGNAGDDARMVAMDVLQRIFVVGYAESVGFPTTPGAFQTTHASPIQADGYVALLDPSLPAPQQLVWSTLFGGVADDWVDAIAIDLLGTRVTVAGTTGSANLPVTANAFQPAATQPSNQFFGSYVARFDPLAAGPAQLVYASYLLGTGFDFATAVATTRSGAITVLGATSAGDFPVTPGAHRVTNIAGNNTSYVARLDPARPPAQQLVYSTYFGGGINDYPIALGVDALDDDLVTAAGWVGSPTYPVTPGAFGQAITGNDWFVTRLDLRPTGVAAYGASSAGCNGLVPIGVLAWPQVGNGAFAITCGNGPASSLGIAGIGSSSLAAPVPVLGIDLWVNPNGLVLLTAATDAAGSAMLPLPIPAQPTLAGFQLRSQFAWLEPVGPAPCPLLGWSASNALAITIQP